MGEFASKGLAGTALGFGIGGTALGVLGGGLGNLLGGLGNAPAAQAAQAAQSAADTTTAATIAALLAALLLSQAFTAGLTLSGAVLSLFNAAMVSLAANGGYQALIRMKDSIAPENTDL